MNVMRRLAMVTTTSLLVVLFVAHSAGAAPLLDQGQVEAKIKKYVAYKALLRCTQQAAFKDSVPADRSQDPGWYTKNAGIAISRAETVRAIGVGDSGNMRCNSFMHQAAGLLSPGTGFQEFITSLGYKANPESKYMELSNANRAVREAVISKYKESSWPTNAGSMDEIFPGDLSKATFLPEEARYWLAIKYLNEKCKPFSPNAFTRDSEVSKISIYGEDGSLSSKIFVDKNSSDSNPKPCSLAADTNRVADDLKRRIDRGQAGAKREHVVKTLVEKLCGPAVAGTGRSECESKYRAAYDICYPAEYTSGGVKSEQEVAKCIAEKTGGQEKAILAALQEGQKGAEQVTVEPPKVNPGEESTDEEKNSCNIDQGIGWLVCPFMGFAASLADQAFTQISKILYIRPNLIAGDQNSGAYKAWATFRDFANAGFAIVFIIIIFSHLTGAGGNGRS